MNKEKTIPIDFSRNITPFVAGDKLRHKLGHECVIMNGRHLGSFNKASESDKDWHVISYADRPNTGKQPVADDVVTDVYFDGEYHESTASSCRWIIGIVGSNDILKWKPNHEAMLAKFKEQGANTMFTFENTKEATHVEIMDDGPIFKNADNETFLYIQESRWTQWYYVPRPDAIELSRPAGERKEDHTDMDGVVTYALKYKLDDNPDEQVIETWVGDQLEDLINPVSEGCQAGDPALTVEQHQEILDELADNDNPGLVDENSDSCRIRRIGNILHNMSCSMDDEDEQLEFGSYASFLWDIAGELNQGAVGGVDLKYHDIDESGKMTPVFTQEMKEAGQHLVGMSYMDGDDYQCELVGIHHDYFVGKIIGYKGVHPNHLSVFDSDGCKPIDNRTPDEKIRDAILSILEMPPGVNSIIYNLLHSKKLTITLKD